MTLNLGWQLQTKFEKLYVLYSDRMDHHMCMYHICSVPIFWMNLSL